MGDYVDRGNFSVECVILMFVYKILHKNTFFMLRGNHECRHLTEHFTFKEECKHKYDLNAYESIMDTFDALPLCAIMNKQFFCVHGGISPEVRKIEDIMDIDRFHEPKTSGIMCDLLWADPMEDFGSSVDEDFEFNSVRGCSYSFSFNAALDFLARNRLLSIIRAHEAQDMGYKMHRKNDKTGFPSVITLFSAPNYLDTYNNKAAILKYENNVINIRQFNATPHPYCLPGFMNVMTWSLPFVAEKVADVLLAVFRLINDKEVEAMEAAQKEKALLLRNKIQSIGRIAALCKQMRTEREALSMIGGLSASGTELPPTLKLTEQPIAETLAKSSFEGIRKIDIQNEALPSSPLRESIPSPNSLRRYKSRDNILQKKASREKIVFHLAETPTTEEPLPEIKEDILM
uniref:Serine/threonine-protein phosphatase n=1 Tax=Arcella intermedia TaxID=1963864 RepID=A0A6B2L582_9EUKA